MSTSTVARQLLGLKDRTTAEAVASSQEGIRTHHAILRDFNTDLQLVVDQHRAILDLSPDAQVERHRAMMVLGDTIQRVITSSGPQTGDKLRPFRFKGIRKANHMGQGFFVNLPWAWWDVKLRPLFQPVAVLPIRSTSSGQEEAVERGGRWDDLVISDRVIKRVERLGTLLLLSWITESSPAQRAQWKAANRHWDQWVIKVLE